MHSRFDHNILPASMRMSWLWCAHEMPMTEFQFISVVIAARSHSAGLRLGLWPGKVRLILGDCLRISWHLAHLQHHHFVGVLEMEPHACVHSSSSQSQTV